MAVYLATFSALSCQLPPHKESIIIWGVSGK